MGISFKKDLVVDRVQIHLVNKEDEKDLNTIDNQFFFERYSHDLILFSTMTKGYNQAGKNTLSYERTRVK